MFAWHLPPHAPQVVQLNSIENIMIRSSKPDYNELDTTIGLFRLYLHALTPKVLVIQSNSLGNVTFRCSDLDNYGFNTNSVRFLLFLHATSLLLYL